MGSRVDILRSFVRSALRSTTEGARRIKPTGQLRRALHELQRQRAVVDERALTSAVARVQGVTAATVRASEGRIAVQVGLENGGTLNASFIPDRVSFAPRGAKEVTFRVHPRELTGDGQARDVAAAIASALAWALWGPFLPKQQRLAPAVSAHLEGDLLAVDLRDVPAVRDALSQRLTAALIDAFDVQEVSVEEGYLAMSLRLPGLWNGPA